MLNDFVHKAKPTYTVQYNAGGGTGSMKSATVETGTPLTPAQNTFKRTGYTFAGWFISMAEDGQKLTAKCDENTVLTAKELCEIMLDAQRQTYGDGLDKNVRHPYMWACKSHYYSSGLNFYNFPYAFGELFGKGVFAQYLKEGDAFVSKYNQLLRSCGSGTIAEVAASVGIDVRSADFWRASLEVVKQEIDTFCALCEK